MKRRNLIMKSVSLCTGDLKRLIKTPKIYLLMILTLFFLDNFVMDIKNIAISSGVGITPFVYPVFMSEWNGRMLGLLIMVLLMSDAPFYHGNEKYVFIRVSGYGWIFSKILYILSVSAVYQLFIFVASVVVCAPYIALSSQWGAAIETHAYGAGSGMYGVVSNYKPVEALLTEFLISFLICVMIGLIIMCFNMLSDGYAGTILASVFVILDAFLESFDAPFFGKLMANLPIIWVSLTNFSAGVCRTAVIIIFVLIIPVFAVMNVKIKKIREK